MLMAKLMEEYSKPFDIQNAYYRKGDKVVFAFVNQKGVELLDSDGEIKRVFDPLVYEVCSDGQVTIITNSSSRIINL